MWISLPYQDVHYLMDKKRNIRLSNYKLQMNWSCILPKERLLILIKPVKHMHFLYNITLLLLHFSGWRTIISKLLWLSIQSQSETGRDKQRPGGAASCQTAPCMIEDNLELEHKHPSKGLPCSQPLLLHRQPWWTMGEAAAGSKWRRRGLFYDLAGMLEVVHLCMGHLKGNTVEMHWEGDFR